jgi:pyridoxamine 5'-phosphate oxidase
VPLREEDADPDPFGQFDRWFAEAGRAEDAPEAMAVATADRSGAPSVRMVLLKAHDHRGFVFSTSFSGRKARELAANGRAALLFHWASLGRQVRVEGPVARVADEESDALFAARPRASQLTAHASAQSEVVADRAALDQAVAAAAARFEGRPVPRPAAWGGYRVVAHQFEFWQAWENRRHDRLRYRPIDGDATAAVPLTWRIERLQP